ncbi:ribokinase [Gracilaria domingensis]|nr:ribokinase [Gracilaria domingensis]
MARAQSTCVADACAVAISGVQKAVRRGREAGADAREIRRGVLRARDQPAAPARSGRGGGGGNDGRRRHPDGLLGARAQRAAAAHNVRADGRGGGRGVREQARRGRFHPAHHASAPSPRRHGAPS